MPRAAAKEEITTAPCAWLTTVAGRDGHVVVTYDDSGSGTANPTAGAAAILWGPMEQSGRRAQLAQATVNSSGPATALEAKAQACRLGLALLRAHGEENGWQATLAGDDRLVADHWHFRTTIPQPGLWAFLPRTANQAADRLARAVRHAGISASHAWL